MSRAAGHDLVMRTRPGMADIRETRHLVTSPALPRHLVDPMSRLTFYADTITEAHDLVNIAAQVAAGRATNGPFLRQDLGLDALSDLPFAMIRSQSELAIRVADGRP